MGNATRVARWKSVVDFMLAISELSHQLLRLRHYERKPVKVGVSEWVIWGEMFGRGIMLPPRSMDH